MNSRKRTAALALLSATLLAVMVWQAILLQKLREETQPFPIGSGTIADETSFNSASTDHASDASQAGDNPGAAPERETGVMATSPLDGSDVEPSHQRFDWQQVESTDYRTYINNLRSIGCPEQTVSDIVVADVMGAFAIKRTEVMKEALKDFRYWKADTDEVALRSNIERQRREVDEWIDSVLLDLLGPDRGAPSTTSAWKRAALVEQLDFLPETTRQEVIRILSTYAEVDAGIQAIASNRRTLTPESQDERLGVVADYGRKRETLQTFLTPEQYELVEMTASWTADNLRRAMTKFEPTEAEFRAIFREWRAHDEELAVRSAAGQPDPGNAHVFEAISKVLTPDRYARYRETWWK